MNNLFPKIDGFLHGGDYNPDQWLDSPEILERDIDMMKRANINVVSLGIFSWAKLEPQEGVYDFDWLEEIINRLYGNGIYTILATPSGSKPYWMSEKYEEIRRCDEYGVRNRSGRRHNHCMTSPVYREFVRKIDTALAKRFGNNPAVILWHIGNEFGGQCFCPLCADAFRKWLKVKYKTLDKINHYWCTAFWSHTYTDFSQIYPPYNNGERGIHGLNIDWFRFMSEQTADFIKCEIDAVKSVNPNIPVTTNLMGLCGYNYNVLRDVIDIVSFDSYPQWYTGDDVGTAIVTAFQHDLMRCIIPDNSFLLMESTPSTTNWFPVSKLMRPHMQNTSALQAVAHGSDSVQYFQIHKARGNVEKFHGAVIDHSGKDTRVFNDVCSLGGKLRDIKQIRGTKFDSEVAVIFDYENRSALFDSRGPRNTGLDYEGDVVRTYGAFWKMGINTDVIDVTADLSKYKIVAAPMLYMYREGIAEKMREFVKNGGILIGTYHSGIVDEHDLSYLGELPGEGMNDVFGIWNEEIDALCDNDSNALVMTDGTEYEIKRLCAIVHAKSAKVLGTYKSDFYKDTPALTVNEYGKGKAYYIAGGVGADFYVDFCNDLVDEIGITRSLNATLPSGVTAHTRVGDNGEKFIFVENYSGKAVDLPLDSVYYDLNGKQVTALSLNDYDNVILTEKL